MFTDVKNMHEKVIRGGPLDGVRVIVHLGMHKTASSFLQRRFFAMYSEESGYVDVRSLLRDFRDYVLYESDFSWSAEVAIDLFKRELMCVNRGLLEGGIITISDEVFCGYPYSDAVTRRRVVDRISEVFEDVRYILVLRNQEEMVKSIYLQYVKLGGCASFFDFVSDKNPSLSFSRGAYLDYGNYLNRLVELVGPERVLCLLYEDLRSDPVRVCSEIADFAGFSIDSRIESIVGNKVNKSLSPRSANVLRLVNKLCKSHRNPYQLLPRFLQVICARALIYCSSPRGLQALEVDGLSALLAKCKEGNSVVGNHIKRDIETLGY